MLNDKKARTLWTVWQIVESIILICAGFLAAFRASDYNFQIAMFVIIGIFLIMDGGLKILRYFVDRSLKENKAFIVSVFELSLGILFCAKPDLLPALINNIMILFIAILLICISVLLFLGATFSVNRKDRAVWMIVAEYIVAILLLIAGIMLIVNQGEANMITTSIIVLGVLLIIAGVLEFVYTITMLNKKNI